MNMNRRAYMAAGLMLMGVAGAKALTPKLRRSDVLGPLDLEAAIPKAFGNWQVDKSAPQMIVDPQTQATINATYTATLSRVYVNSQGQRIMLSLAYGAELSDTGIGLHYPEVCYPAQGFKVSSIHKVVLEMPGGTIRAKRLETNLGGNRHEPVTYWTMIGDRSEYEGFSRKLLEIKQGLLKGERPDGLLFRISTIDRDSPHAYKVQINFARELIDSLQPAERMRLAGLN